GLVKDCRFWPEAGGGFGERRCSSTYSSPAVWKPTGRRSAWRLQELESSTGRWGWAKHKHHKHSRILSHCFLLEAAGKRTSTSCYLFVGEFGSYPRTVHNHGGVRCIAGS